MSEEPQTPPVEANQPAGEPARIAELEAEIERLRKHSETLLAEKKQKDAEARRAQEEAAKRAGDIEALEKSWQEREAARVAEMEAQVKQRDEWLRDKTVNAAAVKLAASLAVSGSEEVLEPHIKARLAMEIRDGKPVAVVLDKDGKPSAMSIEDLRKEFESNPAFAPILQGTKASGPGGIALAASGPPAKSLKDWTESEKSLYIREHGLAAWTDLVTGKAK